MLSIPVIGYVKPCTPNSGGISRVWVFDPEDMDFTYVPGSAIYSAVALRAGATILGGSGFFPIGFDYLEGRVQSAQSAKGSSNKWANTLELEVPFFGKELALFLESMQQATSCSSLGFILEQNNGKVVVMGEKYVNSATIPFFRVIMDGTKADGGKAYDDPNGAALMFKGDYSRPLYEYVNVEDIIALQGA